MDIIHPRLADVMEFLIPISKGRSIVSVISRLLLEVMSYYLWCEYFSRYMEDSKLKYDSRGEFQAVSSGPSASLVVLLDGKEFASFAGFILFVYADKLLYDNSSPRPSKEFISENSDAAIESFSPSPILVEDSDSLRDEIDLSLTSDDSMPPGIEDDDYDS
nr:reverse transcriptase domain, reverse transcriptase zinc-binding domain protein [Tanacetum cinerariifolium]